MRGLSVVVAALVGASLAVPSAAHADRPEPLCPLVNGPYEYQGALSLLLGGASNANGPITPGGGAQAAARQALGAQYTGLWLDTARQGWSIAFAPGALDADAAKAAIVARLVDQFTPDVVTFLASKLTVLPDKYSETELDGVRAQIPALVAASGFNLSYGLGCFAAGAWRVHVTRYGVKATPEVVAETEALFAGFGDKVHLEYSEHVPAPAVGVVPPSPPAGAPEQSVASLRVRDYVSVARTSRCVRGHKVAVQARKSPALRSITLTAGKRRSSARAGGRAQLKLKSRRTRVTVTVKLRDGRSATASYTFRRCSAKART